MLHDIGDYRCCLDVIERLLSFDSSYAPAIALKKQIISEDPSLNSIQDLQMGHLMVTTKFTNILPRKRPLLCMKCA